MSTPMHEIPEPSYPEFGPPGSYQPQSRPAPAPHPEASSDSHTYTDSPPLTRHQLHDLRPTTGTTVSDDLNPHRHVSQSRKREESHRLDDDLELLKAERVVTNASATGLDRSRSRRHRSRSRVSEVVDPVDDFDIATNPVHDNGKGVWRPPEKPQNGFAQFMKTVHESSVIIRYFTYIIPLVLILLIPLLLGGLVFHEAAVGDVYLMWFMVWLEVVWLSLWAARIIAKCLPYIFSLLTSVFTNNSKKWKDMARMLEVPATLFFWWLAIFVSFLPTMTNHHNNGDKSTRYWENRANIVLLCFFVATVLNFAEKIIIQLIAISFHQRTYEDRIELNKFQIGSLAKLYAYSKLFEKERDLDEKRDSNLASGVRTPLVRLQQARAGAQKTFNKVGDVFGKVAGDFTGKQVSKSTSPQQVVLTLLYTTEGSQALARRLYRTFIRDGCENVLADDLKHAFSSEDEADAAFVMFDRDLNGDISCEEMELACVEIGRERKAIAASLKDLDSVIGKLDDVLTFIVAVIVILVFLSLISKSTANVLTSASSAVLALSWLFSATAQEFLASIIFVFVKHPFDVGDRVDIYNTGAGTIDTFFVKEIALMYTEFKKLEGHVVQAPNSLLNTLFVLNMRRSGGLAEAIPVVCKFGTSLEQIEELRERLLAFVTAEKREYQPKIITELRDIPDMHSVKLNVVFFYKSNWQNELVRLQRRNKFMCALMVAVDDVGIESPNMRWPGQKSSHPVFLQSVNNDQLQQSVLDRGAGPDKQDGDTSIGRSSSRSGSKKVDFSLGVKDIASSDDSGDVFEDRRKQQHIPMVKVLEEREREEAAEAAEAEAELARTTSRSSSEYRGGEGFQRRRAGSAGGSVVSHRNRFFGARKRSVDVETGAGTGTGTVDRGRLSVDYQRPGSSAGASAMRASVESGGRRWRCGGCRF
ncbi:uncharacterized protein LAJ45_10866 [Morchella importuna]|uniref:uncharacterized protein n=1 Tax=Morchella importuna TaxID=1174673 RepID=UPI001E8CF35E|nr:uncharacterized protein LAJ45_10866 [Morchella importuna]KAH8145086.1 hypothetical protein LAJ45_10866 [Morchella importuna]